MTLRAANLIGSEVRLGEGEPVYGTRAETGERLDPGFGGATPDDVAAACALADAAFDAYGAVPLDARAAFLEAIAEGIAAIGDELIVACMAESGLPRARLEGERGRTIGQLRMFAGVVREGGFQAVRIEPALPGRKPLPRPDLRVMMRPLGPVAVFGASNFPLAFSVAGGDTAAALAAGCAVVAKAHPAHPGTSDLVGRAIQAAVKACGLPAGTFSLLFDAGRAVGSALVADPRIAAVGFTGSRQGGLALMRIAAARPVPIPVYAEMSSINPVLLFPAALAARGAAIGTALVAALTLGAGQFCTNPGLIVAVEGPGLDTFEAAARAAIAAAAPATMLTPAIHAAYHAGVEALAGHGEVETLSRGPTGEGARGQAALFATSARAFCADERLAHEVFGAAGLIVRCRDEAERRAVVERLEGQLTAALHVDAPDYPLAAALLPLVERKVGRVLVNGFGTGVEVGHAMVHGGPFPATSDGRSTSVGSLAIDRFLRPVCYQDVPTALLPEALRQA